MFIQSTKPIFSLLVHMDTSLYVPPQLKPEQADLQFSDHTGLNQKKTMMVKNMKMRAEVSRVKFWQPEDRDCTVCFACTHMQLQVYYICHIIVPERGLNLEVVYLYSKPKDREEGRVHGERKRDALKKEKTKEIERK